MALCGDSDQAPLRIGFPQAYLHAGARAALGILIAHHHREKNGQGQHVDVSLQESMVPTVLGMPIAFWLWQKLVLRRAGASRPGLGANIPQTICWQCKDGYVMFALFGGATGARFNPPLVKWMDDEGMAPDFLKDMDWSLHIPSIAGQSVSLGIPSPQKKSSMSPSTLTDLTYCSYSPEGTSTLPLSTI